MNSISQKTVLALISSVQNYAETGDKEQLQIINALAADASTEVFGSKSYWVEISEFFHALCGVKPLKRNCSLEDVRAVLAALDIQVTEDADDDLAFLRREYHLEPFERGGVQYMRCLRCGTEWRLLSPQFGPFVARTRRLLCPGRGGIRHSSIVLKEG